MFNQFFEKNSHFNKSKKSKKSKLASQGLVAAVAGTLLLNEDALAQIVGGVDVLGLDGIASAVLQDDNTLLVTLDSGQAYIVPVGGFEAQGSQFLVPGNFLDTLAPIAPAAPATTTTTAGTSGANAGLIGLGVAALGGIAAAVAGGGGDDDGPAAPPPPPPDPNEVPVVTVDSAVSVAENTTAVTSASATDADAGDTVTFSLSGTDAALFNIDSATGDITFAAAPDFESPNDAGGDNVFDITVNASDGEDTSSQDVAITVTDVNDEPVITSAAAVSVAENQTAALTATATDQDGDALTFSLSGTDASLFAIDATTGVITFIGAPDFEMPGDAGADNVFDVTVSVTDGTATTSQDVAITVTDVVDVVTGLENSDDTLTGGSGADMLDGLSGFDTLMGLGGDDILVTDGMDISLDGGAGVDTVDFSGVTGVDAIFDFGLANIDGSDANINSIIDLLNGNTIIPFAEGAFASNLIENENVIGSDFNDFIVGTDLVNTLDGGDGNDILIGLIGDDVLNGGSGNDELLGGEGDDILNGGPGNDVLFGSEGDDVINGGDGDDTLDGFTGNNILDGGPGNDTAVIATPGDDVILIDNGDGTFTSINNTFDVIDELVNIENFEFADGTPVEVSDAIVGTSSDDMLTGTADDDILEGLAGNDTVSGGAGNDTIDGGAGQDILEGQDGDDILITDGMDEFLDGGAGIDTVDFSGVVNIDTENAISSFTNRDGELVNLSVVIDLSAPELGLSADIIFAGDNGVATSTGLQSVDNVIGTNSNDLIIGNGQDNVLDGGLGSDFISGVAGNDVINGGPGSDILIAGDDGSNVLNGGPGNDVLFGASVIDGMDILNGGDGNDLIFSGFNDDIINGGDGDDVIFTFDSGNNIIDGGPGNDTALLGVLGNDIVLIDNGDGTFTSTNNTSDSVNQLSNIENFEFTDGTPVPVSNALSAKPDVDVLTEDDLVDPAEVLDDTAFVPMDVFEIA